jgi:hypothetical protein
LQCIGFKHVGFDHYDHFQADVKDAKAGAFPEALLTVHCKIFKWLGGFWGCPL